MVAQSHRSFYDLTALLASLRMCSWNRIIRCDQSKSCVAMTLEAKLVGHTTIFNFFTISSTHYKMSISSLAGQSFHKREEEGSGVAAAQSDCSTSSPILWGCPKGTSWPIRYQIFLFNNLLGLSLPFALINQVLGLHEYGSACTA